MALLKITDVTVAFGDKALLNAANLTLEKGQRIGLLGRNGEGKTTLLNLIDGNITPDEGTIQFDPDVSVAFLKQTPDIPSNTSVFDLVTAGLGDIGHWISQDQSVTINSRTKSSDQMRQLSELQQKLDSCNGWNLKSKVEKILSRLELPTDTMALSLSGGLQRRALMAKALVGDPQVLLLDEPTNHLDVETILWLEKQIRQFPGVVLFITHDRQFLQNVATHIADLADGKLTIWPEDYPAYLKRKQALLEQETRQHAEFDKRLSREEVWIRQGIKARRTRNEGRVRTLHKMRQQRSERRDKKGNVRFSIAKGHHSGKLVIEATDLRYGYGNDLVIDQFSLTIQRRDRIGLIGPNGIGKTTLLKVLLGKLTPENGIVRHGTHLQIAYFDQLRNDLALDQTVVEYIGQGQEHITINGQSKHIIRYLSDFLFTPSRARSPVRSLSGGERTRALLAKLFSKPANVLVLDEPTNDLDIETLELLEELLLEFEGTLMLVSHDRTFMDHVITSVLSFEGNGVIREYIGGYSDWLRQRPPRDTATHEKQTKPTQSDPISKIRKKPKPSYQKQRAVEKLQSQIESLEEQQAILTTAISRPDFYQKPHQKVSSAMTRLKAIDTQLDQCYQRWSELDNQ